MTFRLTLPLEVQRPGDDLNVPVAVAAQVVYQGGKWRALCCDPPVSTMQCDSLEQALVAIAKDVVQDMQHQGV